jgi:hypothetical protein
MAWAWYDFGTAANTGALAALTAPVAAPALFAAMALAYPLSFFVKAADAWRWLVSPGGGVAVVVAGAGLIWSAGRRPGAWRLWAVLGAVFTAAILPYLARLFALPAGAAFHLTYLVGGRVFYWPFVFVAMGLGLAVRPAWRSVRGSSFLFVAAVVAYAVALRLYGPADFAALQMTGG